MGWPCNTGVSRSDLEFDPDRDERRSGKPVTRPTAFARRNVTRQPQLDSSRCGRSYPELFEEVYGTPDVTPARIAMAIGTHERTLFSDRTPLDRDLQGITPLTESENNGRAVFIDRQCNSCHNGALLSDHAFHNIGVRPQTDDLGRGGVSSEPIMNGSFKTPNLRNLSLRGPLMDGLRQSKTLSNFTIGAAILTRPTATTILSGRSI